MIKQILMMMMIISSLLLLNGCKDQPRPVSVKIPKQITLAKVQEITIRVHKSDEKLFREQNRQFRINESFYRKQAIKTNRLRNKFIKVSNER